MALPWGVVNLIPISGKGSCQDTAVQEISIKPVLSIKYSWKHCIAKFLPQV